MSTGGLISIGILMLKIRRSQDRLIFNIMIPIPGRDSLYIETGPCFSHNTLHYVPANMHRWYRWWHVMCLTPIYSLKIPRTKINLNISTAIWRPFRLYINTLSHYHSDKIDQVPYISVSFSPKRIEILNQVWPSDAAWCQRSRLGLTPAIPCLYGAKPLLEPMAVILSIGPFSTIFVKIWVKIYFSFAKMLLKLSSAKYPPLLRPMCWAESQRAIRQLGSGYYHIFGYTNDIYIYIYFTLILW